MVAALFVERDGIYPALLDIWYDEIRDARTYPGPEPVVAHPPCARWSRLAESVQARMPHLRVGEDGGCFAFALSCVRRYGGVLEHPSETKAFAAHGLPAPARPGWQPAPGGWVCEVWQSAYGHLATKRTWLYYKGDAPPFDLRWERREGAFVVGGDSAKRRKQANPKPRLSAAENLATPPDFARELIKLAAHSRVQC